MAKFRPGPLISEIRNALGSQVFSRNQWGPMVRARVDPHDTLTPDRDFTQDAMRAANTAWQTTLTDAQRIAWIQFALAMQVRARSPIATHLNGPALFAKLWLLAFWWSQNFLTNPPNNINTPALESTALSLNGDTETLEISFAPSPVPAGQILMVYATPPMNPGVSRPNRWFKPIVMFTAGTASPQNIFTEYVDAFHQPDPQKKIFTLSALAYVSNNMPSVRQQTQATNTGVQFPMLIAEVTLTDAQIKALPTTPVTIVPAVPARIITPFLVSIQVDPSAGAYGNISASATNFMSLFVGEIATARILNTEALNGVTKSFALVPPFTLIDALPPTIRQLVTQTRTPLSVTNQPAQINCTNALGNFTGGNAANTMKVTVYYRELTPI